MSRWAAAALGALIACRGPTAAPIGARVGPAITAAIAAAEQAREPWRCAAEDGPGAPDETLAIGGRTWQITGHAMTLAPDGSARGERAIGVFSDAGGSAPSTLAALSRLRTLLGDVDLVLTLGGMGSTTAEIDAVLAVLVDGARWPVVALPGDLEAVTAQRAAIAAARRRGSAVYDGRLIQRIALAGDAIALLPGASAASRLGAGADGCLYHGSDAARVFRELTGHPGLRIVASAEAPRSDGDPPAGDLAITAGAGQEIDIALHGAPRGTASPARTGGRDSAAVDLTPGSCDAMPRLPGAPRRATAGVLVLRGTTWRWQPIEDR